MSEVGLVVRLHKLGLLPEANRKTFVKAITEYAVEGQDLTAMTSKSSAACSPKTSFYWLVSPRAFLRLLGASH